MSALMKSLPSSQFVVRSLLVMLLLAAPSAPARADVDAGVDATTDAGPDGGTDAGTDAGVDATTDAGVDATADAGVDAAPSSTPPTPTQPAVERGPRQVLANDYLGHRLFVIYPSLDPAQIPDAIPNFGSVNLEGEEAHALYDVLAVKARHLPSTEYFRNGTVKVAGSIACYRQFRRTAPRGLSYECEFAYDYRTGLLRPSSASPTPKDRHVARVKKDFNGESLALIEDKKTSYGIIRLEGQDAEVAFGLLQARESSSQEGYDGTLIDRTTPGVSCSEFTPNSLSESRSYNCAVLFDYRTGLPQALR